MKTTVRVVAHLIALPGHQEALKSVLTGLVEPTRQEDGCLLYELLQNQEDPTDFVFVEEWESEALINAHLDSPHINEAEAKLEGLLAAPPDIRLYRLLV
jgi:quinol monooxygenase YgiN